MLHVITSNVTGIKHLNGYVQNFILVDTTTRLSIPSVNDSYFQFDIYHEDGMDLESLEDYVDDSSFRYNLLTGIQPGPIIETMAEKILTEDQEAKAKDPTNPPEMMIAFACDYDWNQSAVKRFNGYMKEHLSELRAVNLFTVLKVPSSEKLAEYVRMALSTEFVYPEDPVSYGYAVYQTLSGLVR